MKKMNLFPISTKAARKLTNGRKFRHYVNVVNSIENFNDSMTEGQTDSMMKLYSIYALSVKKRLERGHLRIAKENAKKGFSVNGVDYAGFSDANIACYDKVLKEEYTDLVNMGYIIAVERKAQNPEKEFARCMYYGMYCAWYRLMKETFGAQVRKGTNGNAGTLGRRTTDNIDDYIDVAEKKDFTTESVLKIDIENACKDEKDKAIIASRINGKKQTETAKELNISQVAVCKRLAKIEKAIKA